MKQELEFKLTIPIQAHVKGNIEYTDNIVLYAPSNANRRQCAQLKQGFFRAMKSHSDSSHVSGGSTNNQDSDMKAEDIVTLLLMSDIDYDKYIEHFRELMINGGAKVNGNNLTAPRFDSIATEDTDRMLGDYLLNFLLSSLLSRMA